MLSDPIFVIDAFASSALLILGGLTLIKNNRVTRNRIFFAFVFGSSFWIISNYYSNDYALSGAQALIANRLTLFFPGIAMAAFAAFVISFTRPQILQRYIRPVIFINLFSLIVSLTPFVADSVHKQGGVYAIDFGLLAPVYFLVMFSDLCLAIWMLVRGIRKTSGLEKMRLRIIAWTGLSVLSVNFITNAIVPLFSGDFGLTNLGPLSIVIMVGGLLYSMAKYSLFDIHFFVVRAAAYLSTLFAITIVFILPFVLLLSRILGTALSVTQVLMIVLSSAALLYILQYLRHFFDRVTSAVFFRHLYDLQDVLDRLSEVLVRTADQKMLRDQTAVILQDALRVQSLRYILFSDNTKKDVALIERLKAFSVERHTGVIDADEIGALNRSLAEDLHEAGVALAIRLHTTDEELGYMILGYRQSGELYMERDLRLLSVAADEIAISLQNVLRFEQIQRFNVTLQEEVDSKTRELQRKNKRLEDLDNIKDDFISMASHQLRTPLTSVKGYLSMVLEGDAGTLNATQEQMLKQAFTSSQRMVFLITDLLNVSRLKTGKFIIDATPTNLGDVVEQELDQLRETAQAKNITISYDRPTNFPELMIDEVKIRQVIMNFVDNAIYYTREGGRINVELNDLRSTVELRVNDNGIGVPKSEQHHLFTKFYRATNARKARPDGTGLGLFMAQKVVVAQGGAIIFTSKEGVGSTFGFTLPKAKLAVHEQGKPEDGEKTVAVSPAPKPRREVTTK